MGCFMTAATTTAPARFSVPLTSQPEFGGHSQVPLAVPDAWGYTLHEPCGVCAAILPFSESALQAGHLRRLAGFVLGSSNSA
jgi:acyl-CoA reductase-like NAD-dependent aldehyde dehydrogenase